MIIAYAIVGGVGFLVDASLLTILTRGLSMDVFPSRCMSFAAATIATWMLNRAAVFPPSRFAQSNAAQEYGRYLGVQIAGALTNLSIFFLLIELWPALGRTPALPLAVGAVTAMSLTYAGARKFVFN